MIVPVLTQPREDLEEDLDFFFKLTDIKLQAHQFNYNNSLVALHEGQIIGFITSWHDDQPGAFIDMLLVHPDYRNRGVGYYLAAAMKAILEKRGVTRIYIILDNHEIIAPLEKHGFKKRKGFYLMEWSNE